MYGSGAVWAMAAGLERRCGVAISSLLGLIWALESGEFSARTGVDGHGRGLWASAKTHVGSSGRAPPLRAWPQVLARVAGLVAGAFMVAIATGARVRSCQLPVSRGAGRQGHVCRAGLASCFLPRSQSSQQRQVPARHVTPPSQQPGNRIVLILASASRRRTDASHALRLRH